MGKRKSSAKPPPKKVLTGLNGGMGYLAVHLIPLEFRSMHATASKGTVWTAKSSQHAMQQQGCSVKQPLQLFLVIGWFSYRSSLVALAVKMPLGIYVWHLMQNHPASAVPAPPGCDSVGVGGRSRSQPANAPPLLQLTPKKAHT